MLVTGAHQLFACSLKSINGCMHAAYIRTLLTSTGLDKIFEDMSQTSGTPLVSGTKSNSTPINVIEKKIILVINQVSAKSDP